MIKGSIQEEDITIVNIYASNIGAPQSIRQMLTAIKGEIDSNTIIVGDFNTPLSGLFSNNIFSIKPSPSLDLKVQTLSPPPCTSFLSPFCVIFFNSTYHK